MNVALKDFCFKRNVLFTGHSSTLAGAPSTPPNRHVSSSTIFPSDGSRVQNTEHLTVVRAKTSSMPPEILQQRNVRDKNKHWHWTKRVSAEQVSVFFYLDCCCWGYLSICSDYHGKVDNQQFNKAKQTTFNRGLGLVYYLVLCPVNTLSRAHRGK